MDRDTFRNMTDVTTIGYSIGDFERLADDDTVVRACVDPQLVARLVFNRPELVTSCVIDFPFGSMVPNLQDVGSLVLAGAQELDIPLPIQMIHDMKSVLHRPFTLPASIETWVRMWEPTFSPRLTHKIILHTDLIEKMYEGQAGRVIGLLAQEIGRLAHHANLVMKTSTGYGPGGATTQAVQILKSAGFRVKASGGIRSVESAQALLEAGADLFGIGYSSYRKILEELG